MIIESKKFYLHDSCGSTFKAMAPLIAVKNLACLRPEGDPIFVNVNFDVNEGDIVILRARSGTG
jgi:ABC-type transport system involved in cytochrome bd biosynthesis fused ATPase/permease subunit